jgi:hypothetical protein
MTAMPSIDPALPWAEQIDRAEPDLLRGLLKTFVQALMSAEADAVCGAPYGVRSEERVNSRNGYRPSGTPVPARSSSRSPSCARARTTRTGCSSAASALSGRSRRWWRPATCSGSRRAGWRSSSRRSGSPG